MTLLMIISTEEIEIFSMNTLVSIFIFHKYERHSRKMTKALPPLFKTLPGTRLKKGGKGGLTAPAFWLGSRYTEGGSHLEGCIDSTRK
jgi:hypothetical protein